MAERKAALFIPFTSVVWPKLKSVWNAKDKYNQLDGAGGEQVYAPEAGRFVPAGDGTAILSVNDGDVIRDWYIINRLVMGLDKDTLIAAGTPLGLSEGPLRLALVTGPKNGKIDTVLDPVKYLQDNKAKFVDRSPELFQGASRQFDQEAHNAAVAADAARKAAAAEAAARTAAAGAALATEQARAASALATTNADPNAVLKATPITTKHLIVAGVAGIGLGSLVVWGLKKR